MHSLPEAYKQNKILASMPDDVLQLFGSAREVTLSAGCVLSRSGGAVEHLYFICDGVAFSGRSPVGIVGREGVAGAIPILQPAQESRDVVMQVAGSSICMSASEVTTLAGECQPLKLALEHYARWRLDERARLVAIAARNSLLERTAGRILMCHDRIDGDLMPLTRSFLQTLTAASLEALGDVLQLLELNQSIRSTPGWIEVRDRERLLQRAGAAYLQIVAPLEPGLVKFAERRG